MFGILRTHLDLEGLVLFLGPLLGVAAISLAGVGIERFFTLGAAVSFPLDVDIIFAQRVRVVGQGCWWDW